jgi:hypothetical protein
MVERRGSWLYAVFALVALITLPAAGAAQTAPSGLYYGVESGEQPPYRLGLGVSAGAMHTVESETEGQLAGTWNLSAQFLPFQRLFVDLRLGARRYDQQYISPTGPAGRSAREVTASETRWDGGVNVGYELVSGATDGLFAVAPYLGLRVLGLDNRLFPSWAGAPKLGLQAGLRPVDAFRVEGNVSAALPLFGQTEPGDVMGGPKFLWTYDLAVLTKMSERISLRFSFVGESLVRERTVRQSLGATAGVDVRFFRRASSDGGDTETTGGEGANQQEN